MKNIKTSTKETSVNSNYAAILALGFKIEIKSQSSGKSRAYLTDETNGRISENGTAIFVDFYDNKGQSVNPVTSRVGSHLDSGLKTLLDKAKSIDWFAKPTPKSKKQKPKL